MANFAALDHELSLILPVAIATRVTNHKRTAPSLRKLLCRAGEAASQRLRPLRLQVALVEDSLADISMHYTAICFRFIIDKSHISWAFKETALNNHFLSALSAPTAHSSTSNTHDVSHLHNGLASATACVLVSNDAM